MKNERVWTWYARECCAEQGRLPQSKSAVIPFSRQIWELIALMFVLLHPISIATWPELIRLMSVLRGVRVQLKVTPGVHSKWWQNTREICLDR